MKVALGISYDGGRYHGWQKQPDLLTVQGKLEAALTKVADQPIEVVCAGRTDTAVHATQQVVHFETSAIRNDSAWIFGVNSNLPKDISVQWAGRVPAEFSARFDAVSRRYIYLIYNNPVRFALHQANLTWQLNRLDEKLMDKAGEYLIGEHDFTSFRSHECQSHSPMRRVHALTVERYEDIVAIDITANAFLHHMVRNIAGVLIAIGCGKQPVEWIADVLAARDRRSGAETAPPYGLYLTHVRYPEVLDLCHEPIFPLLLPEDLRHS